MRVTIRNLTKQFGDTLALRDISLEIQSRELFFLLGPSGCGKTTLLRLLAGFYQPDAGELFFGDQPMQGVPPHRRNTAMVFQNYALWPHLTVAENVAYGLEARAVNAAEKKTRVAEALRLVRMEDYARRSPNQLSGGQQQRVALARALVIQPDVLLLDEPLANLDAKLRLEMRDEIRRLHERTQITTIYVTHDQQEALSLADRLAVLRDGRLEQVGEPRAVYRAPASRFVADFLGESNWLAARVQSVTAHELTLTTEFGIFRATHQAGATAGANVLLGFRPAAVEPGVGEFNTLQTTITQVNYLGDTEQYTLELAPGRTIKAGGHDPREIRRAGAPLAVHVRPENLLVLPES